MTQKILLSSSDRKVRSVEIGGYTENLIPQMTSNTSPSGIASASAVYGSNPAWFAFHDNNIRAWTLNTNYGWLQYEFDVSKVISKYVVERKHNDNSSPKDWTFEGSNDGNAWDVLDRQVGITDWTGKRREFFINNRNSYKIYRLNITSTNLNGWLVVGRLEMMEHISSIVKILPSHTEKNFINHGMSQKDLASIDMSSEFTEKHYIQDQTTPLGEGKVFKNDLDKTKITKKISIK